MSQSEIPDQWADISPIEAPDGWYGGSVQHTGGNVFNRVWRTVEDPAEADTGEYFEVGYDGEFQGASLVRYVSDPNMGFVWDEHIADEEATAQTDEACAEAALTLMEAYNPER